MNVTGRIALALLLCGGFARAQQEEPERVRHAYDVRVLTTQAVDFAGPPVGRFAHLGGGGIEQEAPEPMPGELIVSAIQTNFEEDSWSDERNSIEYAEGVLTVTQTPATHRLIAAWLETLRSRYARRIIVEADVIRISPEAWIAAGARTGILTAEQEKALRTAAADPARGSILTVLRAVGLNGQRVYAADLRSRTYVRDLDIEIATSAVVSNPVTGILDLGTVLDVRPRLSPDDSHVLIETRFNMARLTALESFEAGVEGRIQLPVRDNLLARTTVGCPVGRTLLLCAGSAGGDGKVTAVLVRPTLSGERPAADVKSTEKREMRFFDVATLTEVIPDFSAGFRGLPEAGDAAGGPTTAFVAPEAVGFSVSPESLEEWIRSNVEPRSWKNSRNRIEMWGTHFAIVQTPEVLEAIGKFLAAAVPNRARMVAVESTLVAFDEAGWLARRSALGGANPAEADLVAALDAARRGDGGRVVASAELTAMNGERVTCWCGPDRDFIADVDATVAESASGPDPVISGIDGGFSLEIRPTMAGDGRRIQLDLRPEFRDLSKPDSIDTRAPGAGRIQRAAASECSLAGLQFVGEDSWTLAGTASRNSAGRREVLVLLVRARSMEVK